MNEKFKKTLLINKIRNAESISNTDNVTMGEVKCLQGKYDDMYKWPISELEKFIKEAKI